MLQRTTLNFLHLLKIFSEFVEEREIDLGGFVKYGARAWEGLYHTC
jgi:hypothetical protein